MAYGGVVFSSSKTSNFNPFDVSVHNKRIVVEFWFVLETDMWEERVDLISGPGEPLRVK